MRLSEFVEAKGLDPIQAETFYRNAIRAFKEAPTSIRYGLQDEVLRLAFQMTRKEMIQAHQRRRGHQVGAGEPLFGPTGEQGQAAATAVQTSILARLTVDGKSLQDATFVDLQAAIRQARGKQRHWSIRLRFYEALADSLKDTPDATVGQRWQDRSADDLYDRIREETPSDDED